MSFATAAHHEPAELVYLSADDVNNLVHFQAISASKANGPWNTVGLDVLTGETHCSCKGAEVNRECWHMTLAQAAWDAHPARVLAAQYTTEQLVRAGTKAANFCRVYRRRTWRVLPADAVAVVACRAEWFARKSVKAAQPAEAA